MAARLLKREEHEPLRLSAEGGEITPAELASLLATWRVTTGREPASAFEYGPGTVKPTNWVGTIAAKGLALEVVPRGARALDPAGRDCLDRNLGQMLHLALSADALLLGAARANSRGSRFERAVEAFCDLVSRARRRQVLRRYRVHEELAGAVRGQLRFPAQAVVAAQQPGRVACRWVELGEDTPENRYLKAAMAFAGHRVGGSLRRRVGEALISFEQVAGTSNPHLEYERISFTRLPAEYVEALELAREILSGGAAGILAGDVASRSEVMFMPDLFQRFVGRLTQRFAREHALSASFERSRRYLARWRSGAFANRSLVELLPDAEISEPPSAAPIVVLDAKWKALRPHAPGSGIEASDVHQVLAYGAGLGCRKAALVYPWLGSEPPFAAAPLMEIGSGSARTSLMVICVPLLWDDVGEAVAGFSAELGRLLET